MAYPLYGETRGMVDAGVQRVFDFLDDQSNLSAHMNRSSGMMLGSSMEIHMEPDRTRQVGSRFSFAGKVLGLPLKVEEELSRTDNHLLPRRG